MAGQKIRIRLKAYDHEVIDSSARKIVDTVTRTGARVAGPVPLPTEKNVYCVIRSPHKYKDSREHFEMRTHKRLIDIIDPTPKTVDSLMRSTCRPASTSRSSSEERTDMGKQIKGILGTKLGMTQVFNDPTPRICPPSFRKHSTRHGHASNKRSASSNASSVSHFDARRRRRITARSSRLLSASS